MPYKNREDRIKYLKEYRIKNSVILSKKKKIKHQKFRDRINFSKRLNYEKNKIEINSRRKNVYPQRREKIIAQVMDYYNRNKDIIKEKRKIYYQNNKEKYLSRYKVYHEQWYKDNKNKVIISSKKWAKNNKDKRYAIHHNYIARKRNLGGSFTQEEWITIKENQNNLCNNCKKEIKLTVDHIIPSTKWLIWIKTNKVNYKYNDIQNIQGLCHSCNSSKSDKLP